MELVERIDDYGRPAWLGLMVVAFIVFWPAGLAILAYLLWSGRMGCWKGGPARGRFNKDSWWGRAKTSASSGNSAFDDYREETLRRLEEEQQEFYDFLQRLRKAKDKAEFDQFMSDRRRAPDASEINDGPVPQPQN